MRITLKKKLSRLESFRKFLSPLVFEVLKCDLQCGLQTDTYSWMAFRWAESFQLPDSVSRRQKIAAFYDTIIRVDPGVSDKAKAISCNYSDIAISIAFMDTRIDVDSPVVLNMVPPLKKLKKNTGELKDKLLVSCIAILEQGSGFLKIDSCIDAALIEVKEEKYKNTLMQLQRRNMAGADVYPFGLYDENKKLVSLSSMKEKVFLMDFWFTGCAACMSCAKKIKELMKFYEGDSNVSFVSVCLDRDYNTWIRSLHEDIYASPGKEINLFTNGEGWDNGLAKYYDITGCPFLILVGKHGKLISSSPPRPDSFNGIRKLREMIDASLER
jgi:hypothetical protein